MPPLSVWAGSLDEQVLGNPGDAVPFRGGCVDLGSEPAFVVGFSEHPEEADEPAWHGHHEETSFSLHRAPVRMGYAARQKDESARPHLEFVVSAMKDVLAGEDLEVLVLVLVYVEWRIQKWWQFLPEAGGVAFRFDEERRPSEAKALPTVRFNRMTTRS